MSLQVRAADVNVVLGRAPSRVLPFTKMHGLRNDFIIIDAVSDSALAERRDWRELAPRMCDRRSGIGADGVLILSRQRDGRRNDFAMRVINADGSEPEMCGNGLRCAARLLVERRYASAESPLQIETAGSVRQATARTEHGTWLITVDMGIPGIGGHAVGAATSLASRGGNEYELSAGGRTMRVALISTGNPHAVTFATALAREMSDDELAKIGAAVEHHDAFPNGINFQLVHVRNRSEIDVRTWERGCGITQACGSGACASAVAAALLDHTDRKVTVHMRGGDLHIDWSADDRMDMTGPAEHVFEGTWAVSTP